MDIRLSAVAVNLLNSGSAISGDGDPGIVADHFGSRLPDAVDTCPSPESYCLQAEAAAITAELLDGCLSGLTDEHHDVIVLRIWHDLTFAEIGQIFGITESAAARLYGRALARLRESFRLMSIVPADVLM